LSRCADQSFADLPAASARPDKQPSDHRQLGRRPSRYRNQLCIIDAGDERNVPGHDAVLLGDPRAEQAWRIEPAHRVRRPARGISVLPVDFGEHFHARRKVICLPRPDPHTRQTAATPIGRSPGGPPPGDGAALERALSTKDLAGRTYDPGPCTVFCWAGLRDDRPVNAVPAFVTHYYRADRRPFLNLSDLAEPDLAAVLTELVTPEHQALSWRRFGPQYMALRRATERRARDLFIAAGGKPERSSPHYFVLGSCDWFAGLYRNVAEVRLPLAALPAASTSVTYADSITALGLGVPLGLPAPDLEQLIARFGLPSDAAPGDPAGYAGYQHHRVDAYIEVQLWSDEPVRAHVARA